MAPKPKDKVYSGSLTDADNGEMTPTATSTS